MSPERWEQVGELYHAALELEPARRGTFLDQACAGDEELRREVESLIAANQSAEEFIAETAMKDAAWLLAEEQTTLLTSMDSAAPFAAGREIGQYKIISLLGRGGMGEVYLAYDFRLERRVALKLLPAHFTSDETRVRRFVKEARAVSALNHPNIITIYDIGQSEEQQYIVTEFIEGQTLRQRISRSEVSLPEALDIAAQIASALQAAHDAGIIHRDIKPENVMVRPDGLVKLLDFGLAKQTELAARKSEFDTEGTPTSQFKTEPGILLGTVAYMSPEQLRGEDVDSRSDLFSLGILCYEMIAGHRPFTGPTNSHVIVAILDQQPAPLKHKGSEVPVALQTIVSRLLSKEREHRQQRAEDLLADLKFLKPQLEAQTTDNAANSASEQAGPPQTSPIQTQPTGAGTAVSPAPTHKDVLQLRRYGRGAILALAAVILAAAAFFAFRGLRRPPALTERDTVLLADFENKTGDEVFDGTLKQALAVQLEQTPFLNLFSDDRVREALRYMNRPADERLTRDVAREICQRQGLKALLTGSIAQLDRRYSIILEAAHGQTGETIASALIEAEGKDQVLRALGRAATELRQRLGESLASIQKFDAPLEQATTASLEALKAWSRGVENARSGKGGVMALYRHAAELDPNFAKAHVSLSLAYSYSEQPELAAEHAAKAFALKDRVTEREKFDIAGNYYATTQGDLLKAIDTLELWRQTYPRDQSPRNRLASYYRLIGQFEKSLAAAREAHELNSGAYVPYVSLGSVLVQLNRFEEARTTIEQGLARQIGTATSHRDLFLIGSVLGDANLTNQQIAWAAGKSDAYLALYWQAQSASFAGRLQQARELYARAVAQALPASPERAANVAEEALLREAACGICQSVKQAGALPAVSPRIGLQAYVPVHISRALAYALCADTASAQSLVNEIATANPHSTLANLIWLPVARAAIELQRGHFDLALRSLQPAAAYEAGAMFWPNYLRGLAWRRLQKNKEAELEFRKILDHRGWDALSTLYPLAQLELARTGNDAQRRQAYQAFLKFWENADSDLPILKTARREDEALRDSFAR